VLLWVWIVVGVLAVVVLGGIGYGLLGSFGRLQRELQGAERDVRPLLEQLQATSARAEAVAARRAQRD
jgi:hypothetical protein